MTKNPWSTALKIKHEKEILEDLLKSEKEVNTLAQDIDVSHQTISVRLADMEKRKLIKLVSRDNDRRKRIYKITSNGLGLLNKIDIETKGKIFTSFVFTDIAIIFHYSFIFDSRISISAFHDLLESYAKIDNYIHSKGNEKQLEEMHSEFIKKYLGVLRSENISPAPPSGIVLRNEFFEGLSKLISESVMYITIKYLENHDSTTLKLLNTLPELLATRISYYQLCPTQFKDHLSCVDLLDVYYQKSQNITPENYKKTVELYGKNNIDIPLLKTIGDDFLDKGIKEQFKKD